MIRTKKGRKRLKDSALYRLRFLILPIAFLYRKTIIRHVKVIAVVGSFGKTTTTRAIAAALGINPEKYQGFNNSVFLAAELLNIYPWAKTHVLEVGISKKGQMARNARLIKPDIVVVTSIGSEHRTSLGGLNNTREEKAKMVRALPMDGLAVLNGDDPHVKRMRLYTKARVIMYGYADSNDLQAKYVSADLADGTTFLLKEGERSCEISTPLFGRIAIRSIMAALIVAKELGLDKSTAIKHMNSLSSAVERNELIFTPKGSYLLVDSIKSALETVKVAFETLEDLPAKRKVVILGEVEEPPGSLGVIYRDIGADVARIASLLIFVGCKRVKRPLFNGAKKAGMPSDNLIFVGNSIRRAVEEAFNKVQLGDLVLIKGRSTQKLARVAYALRGDSVRCSREICRQKVRCKDCDLLHKDIFDINEKKFYNHTEKGFI